VLKVFVARFLKKLANHPKHMLACFDIRMGAVSLYVGPVLCQHFFPKNFGAIFQKFDRVVKN
jgi:hypothetical protein